MYDVAITVRSLTVASPAFNSPQSAWVAGFGRAEGGVERRDVPDEGGREQAVADVRRRHHLEVLDRGLPADVLVRQAVHQPRKARRAT